MSSLSAELSLFRFIELNVQKYTIGSLEDRNQSVVARCRRSV